MHTCVKTTTTLYTSVIFLLFSLTFSFNFYAVPSQSTVRISRELKNILNAVDQSILKLESNKLDSEIGFAYKTISSQMKSICRVLTPANLSTQAAKGTKFLYTALNQITESSLSAGFSLLENRSQSLKKMKLVAHLIKIIVVNSATFLDMGYPGLLQTESLKTTFTDKGLLKRLTAQVDLLDINEELTFPQSETTTVDIQETALLNCLKTLAISHHSHTRVPTSHKRIYYRPWCQYEVILHSMAETPGADAKTKLSAGDALIYTFINTQLTYIKEQILEQIDLLFTVENKRLKTEDIIFETCTAFGILNISLGQKYVTEVIKSDILAKIKESEWSKKPAYEQVKRGLKSVEATGPSILTSLYSLRKLWLRVKAYQKYANDRGVLHQLVTRKLPEIDKLVKTITEKPIDPNSREPSLQPTLIKNLKTVTSDLLKAKDNIDAVLSKQSACATLELEISTLLKTVIESTKCIDKYAKEPLSQQNQKMRTRIVSTEYKFQDLKKDQIVSHLTNITCKLKQVSLELVKIAKIKPKVFISIMATIVDNVRPERDSTVMDQLERPNLKKKLDESPEQGALPNPGRNDWVHTIVEQMQKKGFPFVSNNTDLISCLRDCVLEQIDVSQIGINKQNRLVATKKLLEVVQLTEREAITATRQYLRSKNVAIDMLSTTGKCTVQDLTSEFSSRYKLAIFSTLAKAYAKEFTKILTYSGETGSDLQIDLIQLIKSTEVSEIPPLVSAIYLLETCHYQVQQTADITYSLMEWPPAIATVKQIIQPITKSIEQELADNEQLWQESKLQSQNLEILEQNERQQLIQMSRRRELIKKSITDKLERVLFAVDYCKSVDRTLDEIAKLQTIAKTLVTEQVCAKSSVVRDSCEKIAEFETISKTLHLKVTSKLQNIKKLPAVVDIAIKTQLGQNVQRLSTEIDHLLSTNTLIKQSWALIAQEQEKVTFAEQQRERNSQSFVQTKVSFLVSGISVVINTISEETHQFVKQFIDTGAKISTSREDILKTTSATSKLELTEQSQKINLLSELVQANKTIEEIYLKLCIQATKYSSLSKYVGLILNESLVTNLQATDNSDPRLVQSPEVRHNCQMVLKTFQKYIDTNLKALQKIITQYDLIRADALQQKFKLLPEKIVQLQMAKYLTGEGNIQQILDEVKQVQRSMRDIKAVTSQLNRTDGQLSIITMDKIRLTNELTMAESTYIVVTSRLEVLTHKLKSAQTELTALEDQEHNGGNLGSALRNKSKEVESIQLEIMNKSKKRRELGETIKQLQKALKTKTSEEKTIVDTIQSRKDYLRQTLKNDETNPIRALPNLQKKVKEKIPSGKLKDLAALQKIIGKSSLAAPYSDLAESIAALEGTELQDQHNELSTNLYVRPYTKPQLTTSYNHGGDTSNLKSSKRTTKNQSDIPVVTIGGLVLAGGVAGYLYFTKNKTIKRSVRYAKLAAQEILNSENRLRKFLKALFSRALNFIRSVIKNIKKGKGGVLRRLYLYTKYNLKD